MYKSFQVQNFRGFKDLRLDDLARVNLIAGKNNTGKSALLEAILTYTGEYDSSMLLRISADKKRSFRSYRLDEGTERINPGWPLIFHNFKTSKPINLCGQNARQENLKRKESVCAGESQQLEISLVDVDSLHFDLTTRRSNLERVVDENGRVLVYREGHNYWISFNPYTWSRNTSAAFIGVPKSEEIQRDTKYKSLFMSANASLSTDADASLFTDVRRTGQDKRLLSIASKIEPRLKQIELLQSGLVIELHGHLEGLKQPLPISSMGEGLRRIISLMLAIATTENGIVLMDEIENGLHHSVHVEVWRAIAEATRKFNVQIFATTHSLEMIRAAHTAFLDDESYDLRLHRLHRSTRTDEITPTTFNKFSMSAAIDLEAEVR